LQTIKKSSDYKKIYQGKKFYTKAFCIHYIQSSENSLPKFGFTVSKKTVSKKAVTRNLVRRRLKASIQECFNEDSFKGYSFVITAIKSTRTAKWIDFINSVHDCQMRLKQ